MRLTKSEVNSIYWQVSKLPVDDGANVTVRIEVEHPLASIRSYIEDRIVAAVNEKQARMEEALKKQRNLE